MVSVSEKKAVAFPGLVLAALDLVLWLVCLTLFSSGVTSEDPRILIPAVTLMLASILIAVGFFINNPNEAKVLTVFGAYIGSVRDAGFWWANPFALKKKISLRVRNFSSEQIKVNDLHGNPIEIAAVVVWQVTETARASFDVENYESFVTEIGRAHV